MMKRALVETVRHELRARLERLRQAAMDAHAAATDPGSKAEGKYDTRSLEASYLAAGQARQVDELAAEVGVFETFVARDFEADEAIAMGALVEVDRSGESSRYLLAPAAGGLVIDDCGEEITLLTPSSALYQQLHGQRAGEVLGRGELLVIEVC